MIHQIINLLILLCTLSFNILLMHWQWDQQWLHFIFYLN